MRKAVTIFPWLISFAAPVIAPASTRSSTRIGEQLGMHPEVTLAAEGEPDCVRDGADPHLERRSVRHQFGDVLADRSLDVSDRRLAVLVRRLVHLDRTVDLADVHERVAKGARHRWVELGDHGSRGAHRGKRRIDARPSEQ